MAAPSVTDQVWRNKWKTDIVDYFAGLGSPVTISTAYPNAPFTEPQTGVWARLALVNVESSQIELGSPRRFRDFCLLAVQLFGTLEAGSAELDPISDRIVSSFRDQTANGLIWRVPRVIEVGRDGSWWQRNVLCPFETDTLVS